MTIDYSAKPHKLLVRLGYEYTGRQKTRQCLKRNLASSSTVMSWSNCSNFQVLTSTLLYTLVLRYLLTFLVFLFMARDTSVLQHIQNTIITQPLLYLFYALIMNRKTTKIARSSTGCALVKFCKLLTFR